MNCCEPGKGLSLIFRELPHEDIMYQASGYPRASRRDCERAVQR